MPCTTRMSSSASRTCFANCSTRCGVSDAHAVTPRVLDLADARADQLFLDRLVVELLHPARRLLGGSSDAISSKIGVGVLVAGPETFEVQAREAAEPTDLDRGLRARRRRPSPRRSSAARTCTRRCPRRCRRPRDLACAGSARSRCRRTRRPADPTCRSRSRLPPWVTPLVAPAPKRQAYRDRPGRSPLRQ